MAPLASLAAMGIKPANASESRYEPVGAEPSNFYKSTSVKDQPVKFKNYFGLTLAGNLYTPLSLKEGEKIPAVVISHPFAAVRQQAALLYAQKLAEAGFATLAFDQAFWGESEGTPRGSVLPDMYVENFSAAVDFIGGQPFVDREKIGALGICASGAFAVAATKVDPRIKALVTVSMYDMGEYFRTGVNGDRPRENVIKDLRTAADQRWQTAASGEPVYGPGQNDKVFVEAKESNDFYRTSRGEYPPNNRRSTPASYAKFLNFYPFADIDCISPRPILFVAGEEAPTKSYSEKAYRAAAEPKEMLYVKGANRTDLYDKVGMIPFDNIAAFFRKSL